MPHLYRPIRFPAQIYVTILGLSLFVLAGCSQSTDRYIALEPYEEIYPEPICKIPPQDHITGLSDTRVNLVIDISARKPADTLKVFQNGEEIYECSSVVTDELTGAGHIFTVAIDRQGDLFRFEGNKDSKGWEEIIIPVETDIYIDGNNDTFEYYYAFVSYRGSGDWNVNLMSEHFGYE